MLNLLLPCLLPIGTTFYRIPHQGKHNLLARLPGRLRNYARQLPANPDRCVIVLMDADANCKSRKKELEALVAAAGLLTKTTASAG